jgi:hypothetical protein
MVSNIFVPIISHNSQYQQRTNKVTTKNCSSKMSFCLKPFRRTTPSKASKKSGELSRASISVVSPNESFVMRTNESVFEGNEDDTTIDASTSTRHGNDQRGSFVRSKQHNKSSKIPGRGASVGNKEGKDKDKRRPVTKGKVDEQFASDLKDLAQFEAFVKKLSASKKGEKLLKDHLMKRQAAIDGRKV